MTDQLGHKQTAALLTLMALAREVSNPELEGIARFKLDGKERNQLNKLNLVASEFRKRPETGRKCYFHVLTDSGWAWCEEELHTGELSAPYGSLGAALYVVLGGIHRHLRRENLRPLDLFLPDVEVTVDEIESRIRTAYRKLARSPGDWVGLVDLRRMLGDAPTADVDAVLKELSRTRQVHLVPESNRKTLTPDDHSAAIRIGGEDSHLLSIEVA
ncbi:MAG: hypothetical protein JWQ81_7714 [Amycolatopsis sp.]|jgi:hypothetical protein|uniref:hypothetical protein n=1 Tax=Amycolatopsis sp. TaxID=37632 RepID=UPI002626F70E|nr:hypothetical protein [Amycolatopsis sp.]MCU1686975.1 hypothetical protein [Amycolatopsis sp.]